MSYYVTRDGEQVSPSFGEKHEAYEWLLAQQPQSTWWAMQHEGYAVVVAGA